MATPKANIAIDFTQKVRPMKPLHGVNNGPLTCNFRIDSSELFKEAQIPLSRLSDTEYPFGNGEFVDVDCIFKCFNNDVDDPASYNFALTDAYIAAIHACGTKMLYRLGCSIEHQEVKVHIYPPKDMLKWAKICEHIIRHYNEGWANGYHYNIQFWEIWAEPNHTFDRLMWGGTPEQFAELYTISATYLKEKFPKLKIGGPAFSNPDSDYVRNFFDMITANGAHPPLDFFSYHGYGDSMENLTYRISYAEQLLKKYGYGDAIHIFDEWNYIRDWSDSGFNYSVIQSEKGAAFNAAALCTFQNSACQYACFYDAQMKFASSWCGLFATSNKGRKNGGASVCTPKKGFYAFKAFNGVYQCGTQVSLTTDDHQLYGVAATSKDGSRSAILIANYEKPHVGAVDKDVTFRLDGVQGKKASVYLCDAEHNFERQFVLPAGDMELHIPQYAVVYVEIA